MFLFILLLLFLLQCRISNDVNTSNISNKPLVPFLGASGSHWELPGASGTPFLRFWLLCQEALFPFVETTILNFGAVREFSALLSILQFMCFKYLKTLCF